MHGFVASNLHPQFFCQCLRASFLYLKWRYGLRSTQYIKISFWYRFRSSMTPRQGQKWCQEVLWRQLRVEQSQGMTHHHHIYTYIHTYIGGISFIPQASKLEVVASKASGTKRDWTLHGLKIIIPAVKQAYLAYSYNLVYLQH